MSNAKSDDKGKNKAHTARFLASFFLNSRYSLKYNLNPVDREIIRYLADCIDMNFGYCGKFQIIISQRQIAMFIGSSARTVNRRILRLIKLRLIKILSHHFGGKDCFTVGILIKSYEKVNNNLRQNGVPLVDKSPSVTDNPSQNGVPPTPKWRTSDENLRQNGVPYNNKAFNNKSNKVIERPFIQSTAKSILKKSKPSLSPTHGKDALEVMRQKLINEGKLQ